MTATNDDEIKLSAGGKFAVTLLTMIVRTPLDAWAVWLFWGWFAVPLGAPAITFWQAMGLDLFVSLLVLLSVQAPRRDDLTAPNKWAWGLVKAVGILIAVGMGAVIHMIAVAA